MKKLVRIIAAVFMMMSALTVPVSADMGPKPSVTVTFSGIKGDAWGTLLSMEESNGPHNEIKNVCIRYNRLF